MYINFVDFSSAYCGTNQSSEPCPVDDNEFFVKNVGGVKKSILYGIGSEISTYCSIASFSGTSPATGHSHELEDQL